MGRGLKIAIGLVIGAAAIALCLVLVLNRFLTPDFVRERILPLAEEHIGQPISVQKIDISLFEGIRLGNVKVGPEEAPLFSAKAASLGYDLLPLLSGRVVIDHMTLESPSVMVVRRKDGTLVSGGIVLTGPGVKAAHDQTKDTKSSKPRQSKEIDLTVSRISIEDGSLTIVDEAVKGGPVRHILKEIELGVNGFSTTSAFDITASAALEGKAVDGAVEKATLAITGTIDPKGQKTRISVKLARLPLEEFSAYIPTDLPGKLQFPLLDLALDIETPGDLLRLVGDVEARGLAFSPQGDGIGLKRSDLVLSLQAAFRQTASRLELNDSSVALNGEKIVLSGTIDLPDGEEGTEDEGGSSGRLRLEVTANSLQIEKIAAILSGKEIEEQIEQLHPRGAISFKALLDGSLDSPIDLLQRAEITLKELSAKIDQQQIGLDGGIIVERKGTALTLASKGLAALIADSRMDLDLQVKDLLANPLEIRLDGSSSRLDLTPFAKAKRPSPAPEEGAAPTATPRKQNPQEIGPIHLPLLAKGTISVQELVYDKWHIEDLVANYRLQDDKLFLDNNLLFAGGKIQDEAVIDLGTKGLAYKGGIKVDGVRAEELLATAAPLLSGFLSGSLDLSTDFAGKGTSWDSIKKSLDAEGLWQMAGGVFKASGIASGMATLLGLQELKQIDFDKARGNFKVEDGTVVFRGAFTSEKLMMNPVGRIGLDGPISMDLNLKLSPELSAKLSSSLRNLIQPDETGWTSVPLKIGGTITSPKVSLAQGLIKNRLNQEADKLLKGLLGIK